MIAHILGSYMGLCFVMSIPVTSHLGRRSVNRPCVAVALVRQSHLTD